MSEIRVPLFGPKRRPTIGRAKGEIVPESRNPARTPRIASLASATQSAKDSAKARLPANPNGTNSNEFLIQSVRIRNRRNSNKTHDRGRF